MPLLLASALYLLRLDVLRCHRRSALWSAGILLAGVLPALAHTAGEGGLSRIGFLLDPDPLSWLTNYLSYFSPQFLFLQGDPNLRHGPAGFGVLHWFEAATLVIGLAAAAAPRTGSSSPGCCCHRCLLLSPKHTTRSGPSAWRRPLPCSRRGGSRGWWVIFRGVDGVCWRARRCWPLSVGAS